MVQKLVKKDLDLYLQMYKNFRFPHIGKVVLENNVEIASGCTMIEDQ